MDESKTLEVAIEGSRAGDNRYRQYHFRPSICNCGCEILDLPMNASMLRDINIFYPEIGDKGWELIRKLQDLEGINRVYLRPFSLTIRKSPLFDWEDFQNDVLFALESVFEKPVELRVS